MFPYPDIALAVCGHLTVHDIATLARTCRAVHRMIAQFLQARVSVLVKQLSKIRVTYHTVYLPRIARFVRNDATITTLLVIHPSTIDMNYTGRISMYNDNHIYYTYATRGLVKNCLEDLRGIVLTLRTVTHFADAINAFIEHVISVPFVSHNIYVNHAMMRRIQSVPNTSNYIARVDQILSDHFA